MEYQKMWVEIYSAMIMQANGDEDLKSTAAKLTIGLSIDRGDFVIWGVRITASAVKEILDVHPDGYELESYVTRKLNKMLPPALLTEAARVKYLTLLSGYVPSSTSEEEVVELLHSCLDVTDNTTPLTN